MIRVLVVEDDPVAADAHRLYVGRVPGFAVAAVAHSRAEAVRVLERVPVDLLLLDLYLPDGHGPALLRALRAAGHTADVIAVTSARDLAVVREGVSLGVVQYVLKPFTFATLRDRLARYAEFRAAAGLELGISRITARRYLEYLVTLGRAARSPQYGQVGRPELHYRRQPEKR
ncbi:MULTISPECIES: response regulator [unclassified Streptomyces]|uniref:response regulator n=1 Tax=unclassified Streptomyces TaxID=2593676 RepID=UPI000DADF448|nr:MULTISPECIES: response regulator [unclassified Streptomyces]PZT76752.1 two-component system response regulator [Streptomyces sp. AC1-42W]PZT79293.1 two-component system response regulator [Streptomyces sp. AC1-42T]